MTDVARAGVRVTRPSAHRMIPIDQKRGFEKGWRRPFFEITSGIF
jgi:hypothetical protein